MVAGANHRSTSNSWAMKKAKSCLVDCSGTCKTLAESIAMAVSIKGVCLPLVMWRTVGFALFGLAASVAETSPELEAVDGGVV